MYNPSNPGRVVGWDGCWLQLSAQGWEAWSRQVVSLTLTMPFCGEGGFAWVGACWLLGTRWVVGLLGPVGANLPTI